MSDERLAPIGEVLGREEFDRSTIEEMRRRALTVLKDRDAIEQLAKSLEAETGAPAKSRRGAALAALGRYEEAAAVLKEVPPSSPARLVLGRCYRELGRYDEALSVFQRLSPNGWTHFDIDMEVAATQIEAGRLDDATTVLEKHTKDGQDQPEYHYRLGCALEAAGNAETAADAFQTTLKLGDHPAAAFRLAGLADLHGDDELAREMYERCLSGASLYVNALLNLGILNEDEGDFEAAQECYARALRLDPNNPRAMLFLKDAEAALTMYIDEDLERRVDRRNQVLEMPVTDFELSVRSRNCLRKMGVRVLGDLARCTEAELLSYKNFGETSLKEIKILLTSKGLHLGMGRDEHGPVIRRPDETPAPPDAEILGHSIDELEFSVRGRHCLDRLEVHTIGDLVQCTEAELLACKNFGQTSLSEIKAKLSDLDLSLKEP